MPRRRVIAKRELAADPLYQSPLVTRFKRVLVPEMNNGQLVRILRSELLVDAEGLNKIQGKPFKVSELCAAIDDGAPKAKV